VLTLSVNKGFGAKLERLEVARQRAEEFVTAGGDLKILRVLIAGQQRQMKWPW